LCSSSHDTLIITISLASQRRSLSELLHARLAIYTYIYKKNENSRFDEEAKGGDTEARENEEEKKGEMNMQVD